MKDSSKEILERLIENEFESTPNTPWMEESLFEIIDAAYEVGLDHLGSELELRLHPDQRRRFLNLKSA
ncbi:MAG TPA: hypothetical protein VFM82_03665 [Flavobacteriaceae bacterium]|nr:hypothetical protein [Flavobacteriaceae bacterium]